MDLQAMESSSQSSNEVSTLVAILQGFENFTEDVDGMMTVADVHTILCTLNVDGANDLFSLFEEHQDDKIHFFEVITKIWGQLPAVECGGGKCEAQMLYEAAVKRAIASSYVAVQRRNFSSGIVEAREPQVCANMLNKYKRNYIRIAETHRRAITLAQLHEFGDFAQSTVDTVEFVDFTPNVGIGKIGWTNANLYHINTILVLPLTAAQGCSFVELVAEGPQDPCWFVSHWWGTPFHDSLTMLNFHAAEHKLLSDGTYWICTFANNQHNLEELSQHDLMLTPFVRAMVNETCQGTVMLMNDTAEPFNRIWCVLENYISTNMSKALKLKNKPHSLEVAAVVREGMQRHFNGREFVTIPRSAALLRADGSTAVQHKGARFPGKVAICGINVDIVLCKASVPEDRRNILRLILADHGDGMFLEPPPTHPRFSEVNSAIHKLFAPKALFAFAMEGNVEEARMLLNKGFAIKDHQNPRGTTALSTAAFNGQANFVEMLLRFEAAPDLADKQGVTPTFIAAQKGNDDVLQLLLEAHAATDRANKKGVTPLYIASQKNHASTVQLLLAAKADTSRKTNKGDLPLTIVASMCGIEALQKLLEARAAVNDVGGLEPDLETPLDAAYVYMETAKSDKESSQAQAMITALEAMGAKRLAELP